MILFPVGISFSRVASLVKLTRSEERYHAYLGKRLSRDSWRRPLGWMMSVVEFSFRDKCRLKYLGTWIVVVFLCNGSSGLLSVCKVHRNCSSLYWRDCQVFVVSVVPNQIWVSVDAVTVSFIHWNARKESGRSSVVVWTIFYDSLLAKSKREFSSLLPSVWTISLFCSVSPWERCRDFVVLVRSWYLN